MRVFWVIAAAVTTSLVTAALLVGWHQQDEAQRFDIAKWHTGLPGMCNDDFRRDMVEDLGSEYMRVGMSRSEVIWLLGPPDFTNLEPPRPVSGWDTGTVASLAPSDCTFFHVVFEPNGRRVADWTRSLGED